MSGAGLRVKEKGFGKLLSLIQLPGNSGKRGQRLVYNDACACKEDKYQGHGRIDFDFKAHVFQPSHKDSLRKSSQNSNKFFSFCREHTFNRH